MKPQIKSNDLLQDIIDQIQEYLGRSVLYQRNGELCRVIEIVEDNIRPGIPVNEYAHSLKIQRMIHASIKLELMRCIDFIKYKKIGDEWKEIIVQPTHDVIGALLAEGNYKNVPVIKGISECPFMRKNGTICDTPGFDFESGYYYSPSIKFDKIPEYPTKEQAYGALETVRDIYAEFPFTTEEFRFVPIALMLSMLARPMFTNVPGFVIESSTAGSGKSLVADTISVIVTGRESGKQTWPEGRDSGQELEKILSSVALDGTPLFIFDNITRGKPIQGSALDKVLTSNGTVKMRILGKSEMSEMSWYTIIAFTGNNIIDSVKGDTRRRVIPARMEPNTEHPEYNTNFKYKELLIHCKNDRNKLIMSLLTVLRYNKICGIEYTGDVLGSFEEWSRVIVGAIKNAGGPDIMEAAKLMKNIDDDDYVAVIDLFSELCNKFVSGATANDIMRRCEDDGNLKNAVESAVSPYGRELNTRIIGKYLRSQVGRIYDGLKLIKSGSRQRAIVWNVIKITEKNVIDKDDEAF